MRNKKIYIVFILAILLFSLLILIQHTSTNLNGFKNHVRIANTAKKNQIIAFVDFNGTTINTTGSTTSTTSTTTSTTSSTLTTLNTTSTTTLNTTSLSTTTSSTSSTTSSTSSTSSSTTSIIVTTSSSTSSSTYSTSATTTTSSSSTTTENSTTSTSTSSYTSTEISQQGTISTTLNATSTISYYINRSINNLDANLLVNPQTAGAVDIISNDVYYESGNNKMLSFTTFNTIFPNNEVSITAVASGVYPDIVYYINWGDGTSEYLSSVQNVTHTITQNQEIVVYAFGTTQAYTGTGFNSSTIKAETYNGIVVGNG